MLRFLECSRDHQENVTPHSHRFDFQCWVLAGEVRNRVWTKGYSKGDRYSLSVLSYSGECGKYEKATAGNDTYFYTDATYPAGSWYSMRAGEIHSIYFARGTEVLFFEGPSLSDSSVILEPCIDGDTIPTFEVKPWMFQRPGTP
jgi:hypothetical protein